MDSIINKNIQINSDVVHEFSYSWLMGVRVKPILLSQKNKGDILEEEDESRDDGKGKHGSP